MNWQCPRCETFNLPRKKLCEVCELAKPKRKPSSKTATKESGLVTINPADKTLGGSAAKPPETFIPDFKVIDRRSSALAKPVETKPDAPKPSEPPETLTSTGALPRATPGGAIVDLFLWLAVVGFNIYVINDLWFVQQLGLLSFVIGMVFINLIGLAILGGILEFIKWLVNPNNSTK